MGVFLKEYLKTMFLGRTVCICKAEKLKLNVYLRNSLHIDA